MYFYKIDHIQDEGENKKCYIVGSMQPENMQSYLEFKAVKTFFKEIHAAYLVNYLNGGSGNIDIIKDLFEKHESQIKI